MLCIITARATVKPNHANYMTKTTQLSLCHIYSPYSSVVSRHLWWQTQVIATVYTCNFCSDEVPVECFFNVYQVYSLQAAVTLSSLWQVLQTRNVYAQ